MGIYRVILYKTKMEIIAFDAGKNVIYLKKKKRKLIKIILLK